MSSRRSAVACVAFVILLCHPLPSAGQVFRPVGPHTIEYLASAEGDVERVAQAIIRADDYLANKYGVGRDPLRQVIVRLNTGGTRAGVTVSCCYVSVEWGDIGRSNTVKGKAYVYLVGPLNDITERELTTRFIGLELGLTGSGLFAEWLLKGLPALDERYARGASAAEVHAELAQWVSGHHDEVSRAFRRPGSNRLFVFTDAATGGAAWLQYLAEQLGDGVHARLLSDSKPYDHSNRAIRTETGDSLESLWQGFLQWK